MVKTASIVLGFWWWTAAAALAFNTVVVDAGHGGGDRGGIPGQRIPEKGVTLDTAMRLKAKLESEGLQVVMTRSQDVFLTLQERTLIANRTRNAIFVSVHFDAYPRRGANGVSTFYSNRRSGPLAAAIHRRKLAMLRPQTDRGVKTARFYVIRNTVQPSVLSEGGYLTCPWESAKILQPTYRQTLAEAIAAGIMDYRDGLGLRRPRPPTPPPAANKGVPPNKATPPPAASAPVPAVRAPTPAAPAPAKPVGKAPAAPAPAPAPVTPTAPAPAVPAPVTAPAPAAPASTAKAPTNSSSFSRMPAHLLPSHPQPENDVPTDLPEVDLPDNAKKGEH